MKKLLTKLEQQAEAALQHMDQQLQPPMMQMLSGEVFRHGSPSQNHSAQAASPAAAQAPTACEDAQPAQPGRGLQRLDCGPAEA